ncbi:hypothetical protein [Massilia pseudoviolaceinigra]|uniref:hypothetical protein n=1 Tax=Massilia pseudoviolaceinigra TaxID=3057165 RepID=UPI002796BBF1|nr:hypothetical protein [Massilia sp. CCM 9206]MDQ1918823.1 hypothetical protein [Massilia sp. CCM 9206]
MAVRQTPPPGFLGHYRNPLWRAAGMTGTRAVSIAEGTRGGYQFTVLELEHRSMRVRNENGNDITTVFILKLGRASDTWQNNLSSSNGSTVWLDNDTLYLARIGVETPVADWNDLLAHAIRAAGYATDAPSPTPIPEPRIRAKNDESSILFWAVTAGLLPGFSVVCGFFILASDILNRLIGRCYPTTGNAAGLSEHNQILFALALCLPLIGHFFGFKVMYDYYGRPGFFWRLLLNIALTGMLTVGGFAIAMEWTKLSPAALAAQATCQVVRR